MWRTASSPPDASCSHMWGNRWIPARCTGEPATALMMFALTASTSTSASTSAVWREADKDPGAVAVSVPAPPVSLPVSGWSFIILPLPVPLPLPLPRTRPCFMADGWRPLELLSWLSESATKPSPCVEDEETVLPLFLRYGFDNMSRRSLTARSRLTSGRLPSESSSEALCSAASYCVVSKQRNTDYYSENTERTE
jgi:hypothetical protein